MLDQDSWDVGPDGVSTSAKIRAWESNEIATIADTFGFPDPDTVVNVLSSRSSHSLHDKSPDKSKQEDLQWLLHFKVVDAMCYLLASEAATKGLTEDEFVIFNLESMSPREANDLQSRYQLSLSKTADILIVDAGNPWLVEVATGYSVDKSYQLKVEDWMVSQGRMYDRIDIIAMGYYGAFRTHVNNRYVKPNHCETFAEVFKTLYSDVVTVFGRLAPMTDVDRQEEFPKSSVAMRPIHLMSVMLSEVFELKDEIERDIRENDNYAFVKIKEKLQEESMQNRTMKVKHPQHPTIIFNTVPKHKKAKRIRYNDCEKNKEGYGVLKVREKLASFCAGYIPMESYSTEPDEVPLMETWSKLAEEESQNDSDFIYVDRGMSLRQILSFFNKKVILPALRTSALDEETSELFTFVSQFDVEKQERATDCPSAVRSMLGVGMAGSAIKKAMKNEQMIDGDSYSWDYSEYSYPEEVPVKEWAKRLNSLYRIKINDPIIPSPDLGVEAEPETTIDMFVKKMLDVFEQEIEGSTVAMLLERDRYTFRTMMQQYRTGHDNVKIIPICCKEVLTEDNNEAKKDKTWQRAVFGLIVMGPRHGDVTDNVNCIVIQFYSQKILGHDGQMYKIMPHQGKFFALDGRTIHVAQTAFNLREISRRSYRYTSYIIPMEVFEYFWYFRNDREVSIDMIEDELRQCFQLNSDEIWKALCYNYNFLIQSSLQYEHIQTLNRRLIFMRMAKRKGFFGYMKEFSDEFDAIHGVNEHLDLLHQILYDNIESLQ